MKQDSAFVLAQFDWNPRALDALSTFALFCLFLLFCGMALLYVASLWSDVLASALQVRHARKLKVAGEWKAAAACYKKAILKRLASEFALPRIVEELQELYRVNEVQAEFSRVLECPRLAAANFPVGLWSGWIKLEGEVSQFLDSLP